MRAIVLAWLRRKSEVADRDAISCVRARARVRRVRIEVQKNSGRPTRGSRLQVNASQREFQILTHEHQRESPNRD
jgi:hypothetical protein